MSLLSVPLSLFLAFAAAPTDAREIVRKSLAAWEAEAQRLVHYIYLERDETRDLDDNDKVKSVASKTHEIRMMEGSPYRRLIERDGKPIPAGEQDLQAAYLKDNLERRKRERPSERAKRIAEYEKKRDRFQSAIREIPEAFEFKLAGEDTIGGRKVWVIDAAPRPGYDPKDRYSHLYPRLAARLWVDQQEHHWVKVTAELRDVATFGWILVRISKGGRVEMEQVRLADGTWAPKRIWYRVAVRVGLLKHFHVEEETTYSGYKKTPQM